MRLQAHIGALYVHAVPQTVYDGLPRVALSVGVTVAQGRHAAGELRARLVSVPADGESSGATLLAATEHADATMVLIGADTHSRVREAFLGGATRVMVEHARMPLPMAH